MKLYYYKYALQKNRTKYWVVYMLFLLTVYITVSADGLPGEYLLSDQWKIFQRNNSPSSNPALLMENMYTSVRGAGAVSVDGVAKLWDLGITFPVGLYNTFALSVTGENGRNVTNYSEEVLYGQQQQASVSYSNDNLMVMLSYASNMIGKLCFGTNIIYASQSNFGDPTWGIGADIGASYRLLLHPFFGFHLVGLTINNIIPPNLSLSKSMPYSSKIRGLYHSSFFSRKFELDAQYDLADLFPKKQLFENKITNEWNVSLQGTYRLMPFFALKGFANIFKNSGVNIGGFGGEFNAPLINSGRDAIVIYQYMFSSDKKLKGTHTLYYQVDIGLHREEMYARRMAKFGDVNANDLYNRAMKLYFDKKYWDAYFVYAQLLVEFPDFFKNDMATYYSGSCLEELDMREEAKKTYEHFVNTFPRSMIVSWAELGLMRVFYRQEKFNDAILVASKLYVDGVSDSIKQHAYYLLGEISVATEKNNEASKHFGAVSPNHPDYMYAQMTLSTLYAKNDDSAKLFECLENCINSKATTPGQKEIFNKALLHIGMAFYEENSLSKAIVAFRMVPEASYYYEDALLASGWAARRARQWNDCIEAGQKLMRTSKKVILQCESLLMQAYGYTMMKQYANALVLLEHGIKKANSYSGFPNDSLETVKITYESDRMVFDFFGEQVAKIALRGSNTKKSEVDSMHNEQIRFQKKMDEYLKNFENAKRIMFFERSLKNVKEDMDFIIAKVQKMKNSNDNAKGNEKNQQMQNELSREIERLKKEMEKLE